MRRRGRLTLGAVGLLAGTSSLIAVAEVVIRGLEDHRTLIALGTAIYSIIALVFLRYSGAVRATGISILLALQAACTSSFFVSEVSETASLVWHFVIPPTGMFLLGTFGGALLTVVCLSSLVVAQGVIPAIDGAPLDPLLLVVQWAAMLVIAMLSYLFERSRKSAARLASQRQHETEQALAAAEQASRHKSEFLANVSHEIRTPMNAILTSHHLLLEQELDPAHQELLELTLKSGDSLIAILDDILDVSKVEAGQLRLVSRPFSPRAVIHSVEQLMRPVAQTKDIELRVELHLSLYEWVVGDPVRLRQILFNLVNNGIKFTPHGGRVTLSARVGDDGLIVFTVEDTGPGIPDEMLDAIFEPFYQDEKSTRGTGLGLTISRDLAHLMGGRISVVSKRKRGSRFDVRLPLTRKTQQAASETIATIAPSTQNRSKVTKKTILIAEDNAINRVLTTRMLFHRGYQVQSVADGLSAVEAVQQGGVSLVLMDCSMPVLDGFEATRQIRQLGPPQNSVPIVAMTANAMQGERQRCLTAGMCDYLSKPVKPADLYQVIERWLAETGPNQVSIESKS